MYLSRLRLSKVSPFLTPDSIVPKLLRSRWVTISFAVQATDHTGTHKERDVIWYYVEDTNAVFIFENTNQVTQQLTHLVGLIFFVTRLVSTGHIITHNRPSQAAQSLLWKKKNCYCSCLIQRERKAGRCVSGRGVGVFVWRKENRKQSEQTCLKILSQPAHSIC